MRRFLLIGMSGILMIFLPTRGAVATNVYHTNSEWQAIDTFWQNLYYSLPRNWEQMRFGLINAENVIRQANIDEPQRSQLYPTTINIARIGSEVVTLDFVATANYWELIFFYDPLKFSEEGVIPPYHQKIVYQFRRSGRSTPQRQVWVMRPSGKKNYDGSPLLIEVLREPTRSASDQDFFELTDILEKLALDHLRDREWLLISRMISSK